MAMLEAGVFAPDFTLKDQKGNEVRLSQFRGKKVVVYFYPKDLTPGCTREACAYSGLSSQFDADNVVILGISKDSVASHEKFAVKHNLPFILFSETQLLRSYLLDRCRDRIFAVENTTVLCYSVRK